MANKNYLDHSPTMDVKRQSVYSKLSTHCKNCGHTVLIIGTDRIICDWCGYWVYKDAKTEFKYKMLENLKKK